MPGCGPYWYGIPHQEPLDEPIAKEHLAKVGGPKKIKGWFGDTPRGFRLFLTDPPLLVGAMALGPLLGGRLGDFSWLPFFVMGHYFLFCNVFRIRLWLELVWAALLVIVFWRLAASASLDMATLTLAQTPATLAVMAWEAATGNYKGVFSRP